MSVMQDMKVTNGLYNTCNLCGDIVKADDRYMRMTVYGRSETRKCHCECFKRYMQVDNTEIFNSTKIRKNGIVNRIKISLSADDMTALKGYMISSGYTYIRANQTSVCFMSPKFSGCSSISKMLKKATEKFNIKVVGCTVYNLNDNTEAVITMKSGINTDYTEAVRLFNKNKSEKLAELLKEKN